MTGAPPGVSSEGRLDARADEALRQALPMRIEETFRERETSRRAVASGGAAAFGPELLENLRARQQVIAEEVATARARAGVDHERRHGARPPPSGSGGALSDAAGPQSAGEGQGAPPRTSALLMANGGSWEPSVAAVVPKGPAE